MTRWLLVVLVVGLLPLAGCTCGGSGKGPCGSPCASPETPALGVSPQDCRFIEGGHGWR